MQNNKMYDDKESMYISCKIHKSNINCHQKINLFCKIRINIIAKVMDGNQ